MKESAGKEETEAEEWRPPAVRRWREQDARGMARAYAASGETMTAFAQRHGIDEERVRRWLRQLAERDRPRKGMAFKRVRVVERVERRGEIEIVVGGRTVRVAAGFCPKLLRQVLAALEEPAC